MRTHYDYPLLITTFLLVAMGILMIYSSSAVVAGNRYTSDYYFLKRQLIYLVMGVVVLLTMLRLDYHRLRKLVYPILGLTFVAIALAYVPGFRVTALGAARWVRLGPITFQPSEFAKLAAILFLAYSLAKKNDRIQSFTIGFLPNLVICGALIGAVFLQKDLGGAAVIAVIMFIMMFVSGVRFSHLTAMCLAAIPLAYIAIFSVGYRRRRMLAFLDPWADRLGSGYQIIQSLVSFQQGGIFGRGLGNSQQKLFYLPEAHTDFIAAVIAEELGLIGIMLTVTLFIFFCYRGIKIAWNAPDLFGRYLALGITSFVGVQAIGNLAVVMGIVPNKGMVLPFISYGGSSLIVLLMATGVLLSISAYKGTAQCMS